MGRMKNGWGGALLLVATLLAANASAAGQGASATLSVTARVVRFATVRVAVPTSLTISDQDVARGYVEVAAPLRLNVRSNVPDGYRLVLKTQGTAVQDAVVQGLSQALVVKTSGATVSRPAAGRGIWEESLALRVRFALSQQVRPGTHDWPLQISAESY
jgi:hypothetical protein